MSARQVLGPRDFNMNALHQIFVVLKQYLSDGGSLTNATRLCRESLFFIYEAGNRGKYLRHPMSVAASQQCGTEGKRYDHAIPLDVWLEDVLFSDLADVQKFRDAIKRWYHVRIITKGEHDKLASIGLADRMPTDWDQGDIEARYKKAAILFV